MWHPAFVILPSVHHVSFPQSPSWLEPPQQSERYPGGDMHASSFSFLFKTCNKLAIHVEKQDDGNDGGLI